MQFTTLIAGLLTLAAAAAQSHPAQAVARTLLSGKLVYDEARQRLVCVLGNGVVQEYDGASWAISDVFGPANAQVAYDEVRARTYLTYLDVREYDGHSLRTVGTSPILQNLAADSHRGRLVGLWVPPNVTPPVLQITEFDGAGWTGVATFPGARVCLSCAFDRTRHTTVFQMVVAGATNGFETWEWDGTALSGPFTDGVNRSLCAYDATRGQVIGLATSAANAATYAWNGATWTALPASSPPVGATSLATDGRNGRVYLLSNAAAGRRDLFAWNGTQWQASVPCPTPSVSTSMVFDTSRQRAVMFGYDQQFAEPRQHAEFDGFQWHRIAIPPTAPLGLRSSGSEYDAVRNVTVVFGGLFASGVRSGETHTWDGATWQLAAVTGPSPRVSPALAFDPIRGVVVLVGGFDANGPRNDHWQWNGSTWSQIAANTPLAGGRNLLGFDPQRARLVSLDAQLQTWEHDGVAWTLLAGSGPGMAAATRLVWMPSELALVATLADSTFTRSMKWDGVAWSPTALPAGEYVHDSVRGASYVSTASETLKIAGSLASTYDYGTGCGGAGTDTSLTAFRAPRLGDAAFHLDLRADARQQPALIGIGFGSGSAPLGNGCTLLLQNPLATWLSATDADGFWHQSLPLPGVLALRGWGLFAQGAVLDPASPGGFAMTQGLALSLGD